MYQYVYFREARLQSGKHMLRPLVFRLSLTVLRKVAEERRRKAEGRGASNVLRQPCIQFSAYANLLAFLYAALRGAIQLLIWIVSPSGIPVLDVQYKGAQRGIEE